MKAILLLLPLLLVGQSSGQDYTDECPQQNGFFADAVQCDRYYECRDGQIIDSLCPDGLVYDEFSSTNYAKCSFPFSVNCSDRTELQPAQPTRLCPRQHGYFEHEDPTVCDQFYFCVDGVANKITCPEPLIFDPSKGQCDFSDQIQRPGCRSSDVYGFTCPKTGGSSHEHPRYPDPEDCQYFYLCIGGTEARRNGCTVGLVFNPDTLACERPEKVEGPCRTWYNETFLESVGVPSTGSRGVVGNAVNLDGRKRVAVPRRRPAVGQAQTGFAPQSDAPLLRGGSVDQFDTRAPLRGSALAATNAASVAAKNRGRERVRVNLPRRQQEQQLQQAPITAKDKPLAFSLSSDEDIQRFRDSNKFVSSSGNSGNRLTVLSNENRGQTAPVERRPFPVAFEESVSLPDDDENFSSFPAIPNSRQPPSFSRRPPQSSSASRTRRPPQAQVAQEIPEQPLTATRGRRPPTGFRGRGQQRQQQQQQEEVEVRQQPPPRRQQQSRRPPTGFDPRGQQREQTAAAAVEETSQRRIPAGFDPRQQSAAAEVPQAVQEAAAAAVAGVPASIHQDPFQTSFAEIEGRKKVAVRRPAGVRRPAAADGARRPAATGTGGRRLQVLRKKVRPQSNIRESSDDEDLTAARSTTDFEIRRIPNARGRQRQRRVNQ